MAGRRPPLLTVPGQPGVPLWVLDNSAFIVITSSVIPSAALGHPTRKLPAYGLLEEYCRSKGARSETRGMSRPRSSDEAMQQTEQVLLSTPEERAAYTTLFTRMVSSLKFYVNGPDGQHVPTLKVQFVPEDQFSLENMQLGDLFYERNGGLYTGNFLRVGGQILITGSLAANVGGLQLSWSNDFDSFNDNGSKCSFRTNLYFIKSGCPARGSPEELWSADAKKSWPANELQDYNNLKQPVQHFAIGDMAQWEEWSEHNELPWHLEGCDTEVMNGLTGPDQRNKTQYDGDEGGGSMLFPVIHDPASFLVRLHTVDRMGRVVIEDGVGRMDTSVSAGNAEDDFVGTGVATELLVVKGSIGKMTYNTNSPVDLWNRCSKRTVNAIIVKLKCLITMPVAWCAVCQHVKEAMQIGGCGHQFCTGCLVGWAEKCEQSGNAHTCPLCRGAAEQLRRSTVFTQNLAMQLAASDAKVANERAVFVCCVQAAVRRVCAPCFQNGLVALETMFLERDQKQAASSLQAVVRRMSVLSFQHELASLEYLLDMREEGRTVSNLRSWVIDMRMRDGECLRLKRKRNDAIEEELEDAIMVDAEASGCAGAIADDFAVPGYCASSMHMTEPGRLFRNDERPAETLSVSELEACAWGPLDWTRRVQIAEARQTRREQIVAERQTRREQEAAERQTRLVQRAAERQTRREQRAAARAADGESAEAGPPLRHSLKPQYKRECKHNDRAHAGDAWYWSAGFNHDPTRVCGGGCNGKLDEGARFVCCKHCREHSECILCHMT